MFHCFSQQLHSSEKSISVMHEISEIKKKPPAKVKWLLILEL